MGKKLIIKGADFSANAIYERTYIMDSVPSESLNWHSPANAPTYAWTNTAIGTTPCYYPTIYGAKVKCNPGTFIKLFAIKEDGSYRFLQRFDIPASATAGAWRTLILDTPAVMATGEYLGIASNALYYIENASGTGFKVAITDGTGTGDVSSTSANAFPFHRIYDYTEN